VGTPNQPNMEKPMERIQAKRETIKQDKAAVKRLTDLVYQITDLCGLDEEKMVRRVATAKKSEYGRINGLINLLSSVCTWPAEAGDGASVTANQKLIQDSLDLDLDMLDDIRSFRGYHTFVSDDLEIIDGIEPSYEDYSDYCTIMLEDLGLSSSKPTISRDIWQKAEDRAIDKAGKDLLDMKQAVEEHKRLMGEV
jgi:hypothetical protein